MKNKIFTRHIACITLTMVLVACNSSGNKNISPGEEMLEHLYICTADRLNIREEPSIHAEVLGIVLAGDICVVLGESAIGNFKRIRWGKVEAFVSADYLKEAPEGAVATPIGYKGDVKIDIPSTSSFIINDLWYDIYAKAPHMTKEEAQAAGMAFIKAKMLPNINDPGEYFSPGKKIYEAEDYKIETVIYYVPGHRIVEYLVTYDWRRTPVDCIEVGVMGMEDRIESKIAGDKVDVYATWPDGHNKIKYQITPRLKFKKI